MRTARLLIAGLVATMALPAQGAPGAHYYGPLNVLQGVGYKDSVEKDGALRIVYNSRYIDGTGFAMDAAIYRAAELARQQGHAYVELHDAYSRSTMYRTESAYVFARPSDSPAHPAKCRSGKKNRCYTADVAALLTVLSGPSGREPGVARASGVDEYGRTVFRSGFGLGATSPL